MTTKFICEHCGKEYLTQEECIACEKECVEEKAKVEEEKAIRESDIAERKESISTQEHSINELEEKLAEEYRLLRAQVEEFISKYPTEDIKVFCPKYNINKIKKQGITNATKKNYTMADAVEDFFSIMFN